MLNDSDKAANVIVLQGRRVCEKIMRKKREWELSD